jgi:hypothetical protein
MMAASTAAVLSRVAVNAAIPTEMASASSVLRPCPGGEHSNSGGEFGGNVDDLDAVGGQLSGQGCTEAGCAFDGPHRLYPSLGEPAQLAVTVGADLDPNDVHRLQCGVDDRSGPGCLVGVDSDNDPVG